MAQVGFDGVTKRFGDTTAVRDLTLSVADGELLRSWLDGALTRAAYYGHEARRPGLFDDL